MEPLLSRVKGGVDFVSVMSIVSVLLLVGTLSLCNTNVREVLMVVSSLFVGATITAFLYNKSILLNAVTFSFVSLGTYSFMNNFLESTQMNLVSSPQ